jgi:hypothetical protein
MPAGRLSGIGSREAIVPEAPGQSTGYSVGESRPPVWGPETEPGEDVRSRRGTLFGPEGASLQGDGGPATDPFRSRTLRTS